MIKGFITKAISEYYFVNANSKIYLCKAKGKFRLSQSPAVGDRVIIQEDDINGEGRIEEIIDRKNILVRPRIANVDYLIIFVSKKAPNVDYLMIDKLIVNVKNLNIEPIIVVNKTDLDDASLEVDYRGVVSNIFYMSVKFERDIELFLNSLKEGNYVLAGPSGSGKSSFLNYIAGLSLKTSEISDKLKRGKHTTRHIELIRVNDKTYIADTPGFQSLDIEKSIDLSSLACLFFEEASYSCKFNDCAHINEPFCGVKKLVETGKIDKNRYRNYLKIYSEIKERGKIW